MSRDTDTTLVKVTAPTMEGAHATFRLLYDGITGPSGHRGRAIATHSILVGRSPESDGLQLTDPRISRKHVRFWSRSNGLEVFFEDISTNGTFVNGQRMKKGALENGDILRVGDSFLLIRYVPEDVRDAPEIASLVGDAPAVAELRSTVSTVGPTDATVLVIGESGTGKELVAREIHRCSGRKGPFVAVNCSAIPKALAESQLFGHVAGSFTGAREHKGFFRAAHGGTFFLDEVGDLPLEIQPKLLRVVEEQQVTPVGGVAPVDVDVRIVAATNRELEDALDEGRFRGDLYSRLAEFTIRTPPLRDRQEDILKLFRLGYGEEEPPRLAPDLVQAMLLYSWPFNVRELFKVAKELSIVGGKKKEVLKLSLVEHRFARDRRAWDPSPSTSVDVAEEDIADPAIITKKYDVQNTHKLLPSREQVEELLEETGGNISEIARQLQRSRRQVHRYLKMYNLKAEDFRGGS